MSSSRSSRSGGGARLAPCHHHDYHHYPPSSHSYLYSSSPSSAFASSTTASFGSARSTSSSAFRHHHHRHHMQPQTHHHHHHHGHAYHRSSSPTRVNFVGSVCAAAPSVRFSIDPRSVSPGRPLSANQISVNHQHHHQHHHNHHQQPQQRRFCMCSPTTHPGSFRCALHKNAGGYIGGVAPAGSSPNRLNERRSAMTNSLVRIGTVEGELVKRALTALIRPSSHQQRRKAAFQPRPSRLSIMSKASDCDDDVISLC